MTDAEKAALRDAIAYYKTQYPGDGSIDWHRHFVTVFAAAEAMLAQPRLPAKPNKELEKAALAWLERCFGSGTPDPDEDERHRRTLKAMLAPQLYRIRARGLDIVHTGPISISEVPND